MEELQRLVFTALGQASVCWSETPTGVFDSEEATKIGDKLVNDIIRLYTDSFTEDSE